MLAIKERMNTEKDLTDSWREEIKILLMIENEVPELTTCRIIGTLDDTITNTKEKFILIEWIEGNEIFLKFQKKKKKKKKKKWFRWNFELPETH